MRETYKIRSIKEGNGILVANVDVIGRKNHSVTVHLAECNTTCKVVWSSGKITEPNRLGMEVYCKTL